MVSGHINSIRSPFCYIKYIIIEIGFMKLKRSMFNIFFKEKGTVFLFNTLTGAFVTLDPDYAQFYENENLWTKDEEKLDEFKRGGFIVDAALDEYKYYYLKVLESLWRRKQLSFTILTTSACNFACPYCYESQHSIKPVYMNEKTQEKVIKYIKNRIETEKPESIYISFYGGEPLLNMDALFNIGEYVKGFAKQREINFRSEIITNGYLLTKEIAGQLKEKVNLNKVQITIDGPREIHDKFRPLKGGGKTFDVIINNIKEILDHIDGLHINCRTNMNKNNYTYYEELLKYINEQVRRKVKYPRIYCYPYFIAGEKDATQPINNELLFTPKEFGMIYGKELVPLLLKYGFLDTKSAIPEPRFYLCMAPSPTGIVIEPDGTLQKCWDTVGMAKWAIGNIDTGVNVSKEVEWLGYEYFGDECKTCNFLPICGGSCAKKVIVDQDRACDFRKYAIKDILKAVVKIDKVK